MQSYKQAAQICVEAGFDGIEPHGAHGFLLNQFFSTERNLRQDALWPHLSGRMRLALEMVAWLNDLLRQALLLLYGKRRKRPGHGIARVQPGAGAWFVADGYPRNFTGQQKWLLQIWRYRSEMRGARKKIMAECHEHRLERVPLETLLGKLRHRRRLE